MASLENHHGAVVCLADAAHNKIDKVCAEKWNFIVMTSSTISWHVFRLEKRTNVPRDSKQDDWGLNLSWLKRFRISNVFNANLASEELISPGNNAIKW